MDLVGIVLLGAWALCLFSPVFAYSRTRRPYRQAPGRCRSIMLGYYLMLLMGLILMALGARIVAQRPSVASTMRDVLFIIGAMVFFVGTITGPIVAAAVISVGRIRETDSCSRCGYDLTGNVSGVCPECGTKAAPAK